MTQQFFQNFVQVEHPPISTDTPEFKHNLTVIEMSNNWGFVRWLNYRVKEKMVKQVDQMEASWINFINANSIDVESFKSSDDFLEKNLKILGK